MLEDEALQQAMRWAIDNLACPAALRPATLVALAGELQLMLLREPAGTVAAGILLTAQAALCEARATRH